MRQYNTFLLKHSAVKPVSQKGTKDCLCVFLCSPVCVSPYFWQGERKGDGKRKE